MKKRLLSFIPAVLGIGVLFSSFVSTEALKRKWTMLFDGSSLEHWQTVSGNEIKTGWSIEDGVLVLQPGRKGGDIITKKTYQNFELQLEFRQRHLGNTGLKYLVSKLKNEETGKEELIGIEYQLIDDFNHPEIRENQNGAMSTAAVYLIYPPQGKKLNPIGSWNKMKIVVKDKKATHWLNGKKVVEYTIGGADFASKVKATKFSKYPEYGKISEGYILLQDHGDGADFRSIKIREL